MDGEGYALYILGRCYLSLGRDAEALDSLRQALTSHRAAGNRRRQAVDAEVRRHRRGRAA